MNIFKTTAVAVLCFFSAGVFAQDQPSDSKQLDYDIMTWKARAKVVKDVKSWSLKGTIGFSLAAAAIGYSLFLSERRDSGWRDLSYTILKPISSLAGFGVKFCGCVLFVNLLASQYSGGIVKELEATRTKLFKTQKTA